MRINLKQLKKFVVETKSGMHLGKVLDVVLEIDGHSIVQYEVGGLISKKYLINREQVMSISDKKIIVEDNVGSIEVKKVHGSAHSPEPAMMIEVE